MRTPRLRTLAQFAEQEIVVPDGPFAGRRFRLDRHPVARLLFNELPKWRRAFVTGPNQDGKSLLGFVIPTMYLLFERRETAILGVPSLEMVADKWTVDILPVINASRYRKLLPTSGKGSKQGESVLYSFGNGTHLRFMTAGGGDQSRAGFTSRNLIVTETDGFDTVSESSREGSKFDQLCRRTLAFGNTARIWCECTVSTEQGRTWHEIKNGSDSRIALPCPHCKSWVTPDREHLTGWQDADTEAEAVAGAAIVCPSCGELWTNQQRVAANQRMVLVHKGQSVGEDGQVTGPLPDTPTLGFRWTAVNSILNAERLPAVGGLEWKAKRAPDEEAAEKDLRQSQWALPAEGGKLDVSPLDAFAVVRRTLKLPRGAVPERTEFITAAADVGKHKCHWAALAWRKNATPHVIEYGVLECPAQFMAEESAILSALREWRDDVLLPGWGGQRPLLTFIDARYKTDTILGFAAECAPLLPGVFATMSFGATQKRQGGYKRDTGSKVVGVGENYSLVRRVDGHQYVEVNADQWKAWLHARVVTPMDEPSALTLFGLEDNVPADHFSYAKHLTSEKQVEEFVQGQGTVIRFEASSRNNHWLDATMLACVAAHAAGARLVEAPKAAPAPAPPQQSDRPDWMPDRPTGWTNR